MSENLRLIGDYLISNTDLTTPVFQARELLWMLTKKKKKTRFNNDTSIAVQSRSAYYNASMITPHFKWLGIRLDWIRERSNYNIALFPHNGCFAGSKWHRRGLKLFWILFFRGYRQNAARLLENPWTKAFCLWIPLRCEQSICAFEWDTECVLDTFPLSSECKPSGRYVFGREQWRLAFEFEASTIRNIINLALQFQKYNNGCYYWSEWGLSRRWALT